jgi:glucose dehydrogenase
MIRRPLSVSIIAWFLIVMGAISLISTTVTFNSDNPTVREILSKSPIPISVQLGFAYLGLLITIVCGIAMLKGCNWARYLYVFWGIFGFVVGFATSPMKIMMLPGMLLVAIITFFLFRPQATKYFTQSAASNAELI